MHAGRERFRAAPGRRHARYYHGWNVVAVCVLAQVAALALTINCFSLFLKGWSSEFHIPISTLAFSVTLFSLTVVVVAPVVGALADRIAARRLFAGALIGLCAFHLLLTRISAGWQIVALYALVLPVLVTFSGSITAQALVSRWFVRRTGLAMGLTAFGLALSGVVFPPIIVAALPAMGWRGIWAIGAALIALVALPLAWLVLHDRPADDDPFGYVVPTPGTLDPAPPLTVRDVMRRRNFWIIIGAFVPMQFVGIVMQIDLAPIVESRGFSAQIAGGLLSAMSVAALASKLGSGLLADRFGNRLPMLLVGSATTLGMVLVTLAGGSLPMLAIGIVLVGISQGAWTLVASASAREFGAQGFGRAFGLVCATSPIGSLGPPIVARIAESGAGYVPGLIGTALVALAGTGIAGLLNERSRRSQPPSP